MTTRGLVISCPLEGDADAYYVGPAKNVTWDDKFDLVDGPVGTSEMPRLFGHTFRPRSYQSKGIDPYKLRTYLLFWDILDFPTNSGFQIHTNGEEDFLIEAGLLQRTIVKKPKQMPADLSRYDQIEAFLDLDEREPGKWSLASGWSAIELTHPHLKRGRGILVKLYDALPIPHREVHLSDVLKFKERRKPELEALRSHIESVYQRIICAGDGELALHTEMSALDRAVADHMKAAKSSGMKLTLVGLEARLKWEFDARPAFVAAGAGFVLSGPTQAALLALGGIAVNLIPRIEIKSGGSLITTNKSQLPFDYLIRANQDLG